MGGEGGGKAARKKLGKEEVSGGGFEEQRYGSV